MSNHYYSEFEDFLASDPASVTQRNEVYRLYGEISQIYSRLELLLALLIATPQSGHSRAIDLKLFDEEVLSSIKKPRRPTLGTLVCRLQSAWEKIHPDSLLSVALNNAVTARNFLAHHFFREFSTLLSTTDGCRVSLQYLEVIQKDGKTALNLLECWEKSNSVLDHSPGIGVETIEDHIRIMEHLKNAFLADEHQGYKSRLIRVVKGA